MSVGEREQEKTNYLPRSFFMGESGSLLFMRTLLDGRDRTREQERERGELEGIQICGCVGGIEMMPEGQGYGM